MPNLSELHIDWSFPCRKAGPNEYYIDSDMEKEIDQFYLPPLKRLADGSRGVFRARLAGPVAEARWMDLPFMERHVWDKDLIREATGYGRSIERY